MSAFRRFYSSGLGIQVLLCALSLAIFGWTLWECRRGRVTVMSPGQAFVCTPVSR